MLGAFFIKERSHDVVVQTKAPFMDHFDGGGILVRRPAWSSSFSGSTGGDARAIEGSRSRFTRRGSHSKYGCAQRPAISQPRRDRLFDAGDQLYFAHFPVFARPQRQTSAVTALTDDSESFRSKASRPDHVILRLYKSSFRAERVRRE